MRLQVGRLVLLGAAATLATPAVVTAAEYTSSYTLNLYSDVDGVEVYGHYLGGSMRLRNGLVFNALWANDRVLFPAIQAPPGSQEAVDAITSASRPIASSADPYVDYVKVRNAVEGSASYRNLQVGYYVSMESDYFAQMVTVTTNKSFMHDNLNLAVGVSYGWDNIEPLADNDTPGVSDYQNTLHWNVVATQVLTRTTTLRAGVELNNVDGLQHDPYRNVYVAGANVPEAHPAERRRHDMFVSLNQYVYNRSSVNVDYRLYQDDWGVDSHTMGVKLNQYVTEALIVRYRYRYYTQGAADFYRSEYTLTGGVEGFQTGDYRLSEFSAHLFGGRVLWHPTRLFGKWVPARAELMFSYERYFNSNNFSANVVETGLQIAF